MKITKEANSILIEFTDEELVILADSLIDPFGHLELVASEKLANCKSRLLSEWIARLQIDKRVPSIPTDDTALIELITTQPDYANRAGREAARGFGVTTPKSQTYPAM